MSGHSKKVPNTIITGLALNMNFGRFKHPVNSTGYYPDLTSFQKVTGCVVQGAFLVHTVGHSCQSQQSPLSSVTQTIRIIPRLIR